MAIKKVDSCTSVFPNTCVSEQQNERKLRKRKRRQREKWEWKEIKWARKWEITRPICSSGLLSSQRAIYIYSPKQRMNYITTLTLHLKFICCPLVVKQYMNKPVNIPQLVFLLNFLQSGNNNCPRRPNDCMGHLPYIGARLPAAVELPMHPCIKRTQNTIKIYVCTDEEFKPDLHYSSKKLTSNYQITRQVQIVQCSTLLKHY